MGEPRVVMVSGGTYGIGRAVALHFADRGDRVVAFGVEAAHTERLHALADERALAIAAHTLDLTDDAAVATLVTWVLRQEGRVDVLVNNAAVRPTGSILETSIADWDAAFAVNIRGMFLLTRAVAPAMAARRQGVIVNLASGAGYGRGGLLAYAVSKGAVFPFTASLALDLVPYGVRVNTVVPGATLTGMTEHWGEEFLARARGRSVARRANTPDDIARAIVWLASDDAAVISGATLEVGTLPRSNA